MPNRRDRSLRAAGAALLLTSSVLVGLLLAEVFVRWLDPQPVGFSWAIRDGLWVHVPGRETIFRRPEYAAPVRINSLGFRGAEFEIPKAPDTFRVLVLGDSFVEGLQVGEDATFVARIEAVFAGSHPRVEVLNLGVSGFGTTEALAIFEDYGPRLEPDLVLLGFFLGNDLCDNVMYGHPPLRDGKPVADAFPPLSRGALMVSRLKSYAGTYSQLWQVLRAATSSPVFSRLGVRAYEPPRSTSKMPFGNEIYLADEPAYLADARTLTTALLMRLRDDARALGADTWLVLIPNRSQVEDARWASEVEEPLGTDRVRRDQPQRALHEVAERVGLPVIDLYPAFLARAARGEKLYWQIDGHFNATGHEEAARVVVQLLRDRGFPGSSRTGSR